MRVKQLVLSGLLGIALLTAACGDHAGHTGGSSDGGMGHAMDEGSVPGAAANASDSSRDIKIVATDDPAFQPSSVTVSAGEVVTFVVRNEGKVDHEFVLGDEAYQEMHEGDMQEGHYMMENSLTVSPGETKELTWEFDEGGEVLYGCHEPGHYEDGMVGTITVS